MRFHLMVVHRQHLLNVRSRRKSSFRSGEHNASDAIIVVQRIVRIAQRQGIGVVLVQSDPDMESVAADMLGPNDRLVCIGGNTSDESYLNGLSVVRVAADGAKVLTRMPYFSPSNTSTFIRPTTPALAAP